VPGALKKSSEKVPTSAQRKSVEKAPSVRSSVASNKNNAFNFFLTQGKVSEKPEDKIGPE
jgi:CRP-like cAMP-binding protein